VKQVNDVKREDRDVAREGGDAAGDGQNVLSVERDVTKQEIFRIEMYRNRRGMRGDIRNGRGKRYNEI